ncbi:uncharacterized protein V6R79_005391 [Siganus canaliculatus]
MDQPPAPSVSEDRQPPPLIIPPPPPPPPPPPSQRCVLASPYRRHPKTKKKGPAVAQALHVAFWSSGKTEGNLER